MKAEDVTDTLDLALQVSGCDHMTVLHKPRLLRMRQIRGYKVFKSHRLAKKGKRGQAEKILLDLMEEYPKSAAHNTFPADIRLFSRRVDCAFGQYNLSRNIPTKN